MAPVLVEAYFNFGAGLGGGVMMIRSVLASGSTGLGLVVGNTAVLASGLTGFVRFGLGPMVFPLNVPGNYRSSALPVKSIAIDW